MESGDQTAAVLREALDHAEAGVWSWDLVSRSFAWRPPAGDPIFALPFDGSLAALRRSAFPEDFERALATLERARESGSTFDAVVRVAVPGGPPRRLAIRGRFSYDDAGNVTRMNAAVRDGGAAGDPSSHAELRALNARLCTAREEEAARISRELHDGMGQALTALTLDITWLRERVPDAARIHLDEMADLVKTTLASMRRIVVGLRPAVLEDLGLVPAMTSLVDDLRARGSFDLHASLRGGDYAYGRDVSIALFRVLEEALTNVTRHAEARRIDVDFDHDGEHATLIVSDDGRGFSVSDARERGALGLVGMRERMEAMGGELRVVSEPGKGTRLVARVPIDDPV